MRRASLDGKSLAPVKRLKKGDTFLIGFEPEARGVLRERYDITVLTTDRW